MNTTLHHSGTTAEGLRRTQILDTAEKRIRIAGFNGFSFRDIAADVGVKSSSVHYHFPTKETLAAAVIHRYTQMVSSKIDEAFAIDPDPIAVWTRAFRGTITSSDRMCPCTVLGAVALDLPQEVVAEIRAFFNMCRQKMVAQGLAPEQADKLLAIAVGGQLVSHVLGDLSVFDHAMEISSRESPAAVA
jgi:TetR/AcrR family transcriptional regulator, transcriptional repressor for nem operon